MSPFSAPVLGCAAVLASPALYQAFVIDTMPPDVALLRYLVVVALCWAGISLVVELLRGTGRSPATADDALPGGRSDGSDPAAEHRAESRAGSAVGEHAAVE